MVLYISLRVQCISYLENFKVMIFLKIKIKMLAFNADYSILFKTSFKNYDVFWVSQQVIKQKISIKMACVKS